MDWSAVVVLVADRMGLELLLLGNRGELLLISPAAERALGPGSNELGSDWIEGNVAPDDRNRARWHFERVLAGGLQKLELSLRTDRGPALATFDACLLGSQQGVLLVLEGLRHVAREQELSDYDYEVSAARSGAPRLLRVHRTGVESPGGEAPCFAVLHGRSSPCEQCPLSSGMPDGAPSLTVRTRPPRDYVVTNAIIQGDGARVSVRSISSSSLAAVMLARLDELAERASLSKRERSVFGYLMDGRAVEEIASELDISPRTVKFHQANVLQKLGADSRLDLMRLVFWAAGR